MKKKYISGENKWREFWEWLNLNTEAAIKNNFQAFLLSILIIFPFCLLALLSAHSLSSLARYMLHSSSWVVAVEDLSSSSSFFRWRRIFNYRLEPNVAEDEHWLFSAFFVLGWEHGNEISNVQHNDFSTSREKASMLLLRWGLICVNFSSLAPLVSNFTRVSHRRLPLYVQSVL